ncbi:helix-turn-helix domain-containing protein [Skermania piniformis]|uniref:Helix-turn-helix domain-containing protein n=1 Tax=Skermania pinensis TaxID=39122 RepID=A0ABX8S4F4_9ACTN|nr:helix-turn-helix transcriptional regulator [Skermania piniformis]QXQ12689.1 helix-turn-helix domain-containing protein [Skermania piniformis]
MAQKGGELEWRTYGLSIAKRVRALRTHRALSQDQLAELSGLHRNQISNIERNTSRDDGCADPQMSTIYRLARALDVAPSALIPDADHQVNERSAETASDIAWSAVETHLLAQLAEWDPARPLTKN